MEIDRERIHRDDLHRLRTDEPCKRFSHEFVIWQPRVPCVQMPLNSKPGPILKFLFDIFASGNGLKAERIAREVHDLGPVLRSRNKKTLAKPAERVFGVEL